MILIPNPTGSFLRLNVISLRLEWTNVKSNHRFLVVNLMVHSNCLEIWSLLLGKPYGI
ncbi:hypothetical protein SLEP1_g39042 [Rubroshorea leprosula]|uniref:Uncharacterized protein n=1 Tax=Rubroshorea leprosula TaxID=152421 RepID=A0AAV5KZ85_9ROSI|nr:hypothetical protein SLEP1_g39042 [Rubroshorea leprosula]